jgi:hypothetical protein
MLTFGEIQAFSSMDPFVDTECENELMNSFGNVVEAFSQYGFRLLDVLCIGNCCGIFHLICADHQGESCSPERDELDCSARRFDVFSRCAVSGVHYT